MEKQWKIRLLGGVLQGREIYLPAEGLSLGEQGCDVCVPATGDEKIILSVKEGALFVSAGKMPLKVNGRKHLPSIALPDYGVLQVADVAFAFGFADTRLAGCQLPSRSLAIYWALGMITILCIMGLIILSVLAGPLPQAHQSTITQVNQLLQKNGLTEIKADQISDGSIQLSGYCQNSWQMQKFRQILESMAIFYHDNVICVDQLLRNVQDVLTVAGYTDIKVASRSPGEVLISGDIIAGNQWNKVQSALEEVPGLKRWYIENMHREQGKAIIQALINNGLAGLVSMTPADQTFIISGVLTHKEQEILRQTTDALKLQYPGLALIYQNVPVSSEGVKHLPAPIAGYLEGRHGRRLILANNQQLHLGSQLPDGSKIINLNEKSVTFEYQDALVHYAFSL